MHRGDGLVELQQVGAGVAGDFLGGHSKAGRPPLLVDAEPFPLASWGVPLMSARLAQRSAAKAASSSPNGGRASVAQASWS
jgi:hypothetical protein